MHLGHIFFLLYPLTISWLNKILSATSLPGTKAVWLLSTILSMKGCVLFVRILDMILYRIVQQEMCRNSFMVEGFLTLGMRVTEVLFIGLNIIPMLVTSSPTVWQVF